LSRFNEKKWLVAGGWRLEKPEYGTQMKNIIYAELPVNPP
jgi:hypothetical protein